jgi:hypothetical protein
MQDGPVPIRLPTRPPNNQPDPPIVWLKHVIKCLSAFESVSFPSIPANLTRFYQDASVPVVWFVYHHPFLPSLFLSLEGTARQFRALFLAGNCWLSRFLQKTEWVCFVFVITKATYDSSCPSSVKTGSAKSKLTHDGAVGKRNNP